MPQLDLLKNASVQPDANESETFESYRKQMLDTKLKRRENLIMSKRISQSLKKLL